ncbi:MAG: succinate dehydrogenase, cytochrome b556 subunit [Alphaproteobacteria bacterium]|nr:succinate dehydrogenase, cytochrome b556 subunit [Alphaproteobacteria bacterium]
MPYLRPLSPHLQIYKPQLTSILSIVHRFTGIALVFGIFALVYWIMSIALGESTFIKAQSYFRSWYSQIFLFGWSFCFFFHLCNGVRHIFWDTGFGLELPHVYRSGWLVLYGSISLTLCTWGYIYLI